MGRGGMGLRGRRWGGGGRVLTDSIADSALHRLPELDERCCYCPNPACRVGFHARHLPRLCQILLAPTAVTAARSVRTDSGAPSDGRRPSLTCAGRKGGRSDSEPCMSASCCTRPSVRTLSGWPPVAGTACTSLLGPTEYRLQRKCARRIAARDSCSSWSRAVQIVNWRWLSCGTKVRSLWTVLPNQSLRLSKPPVTVRACARPAPAVFAAES